MAEQDLVDFLTPSYERQYQDGTARRIRIIWAHFMERTPYRKIGADLGVTSAAVQQIAEATLSKIRRTIWHRSLGAPEIRTGIWANLPDPLAVAIFGSPYAERV